MSRANGSVATAGLSTFVLMIVGACNLSSPASRPASYDKTPELLARLSDERIREASGIAASRLHPGFYYVHNDSGDTARVFLVDGEGRTRLTIRLRGITAVDMEDIAIGPGAAAGTFDVCVADIGDNAEKRAGVAIHRFPEPDLKAGDGATLDAEVITYRLRYVDGPANAEAFAVHPQTGDGYVFTKRNDGRSVVYRLAAPWDRQSEGALVKLTTLALPPALPLARIVTAADIRPDGQRLALRCYDGGWEWRLPAGTAAGDFERIFGTSPARLTLAAEQQGEALCYAADGEALLTVSEGALPALWEVRSGSP